MNCSINFNNKTNKPNNLISVRKMKPTKTNMDNTLMNMVMAD